MSNIDLPNVTLCAVSDVALEATLHAMERCLVNVKFKDAMLFTSKKLSGDLPPAIRLVQIPALRDRGAYSQFVLADLAKYIETEFILVVQWDGFIIDTDAWCDEFLEFDYIGAPWPDRPPPENVGNGGFSLRSRRLLETGSQSWFKLSHPEDLCICHRNRAALSERGLKIADTEIARRFSREREPPYTPHFGIHGVFALAEVMEQTEFESWLAQVEFGVIGKRELSDVIRILTGRGWRGSSAVARCAAELLHRYPWRWQSLPLLWAVFRGRALKRPGAPFARLDSQ